jgi:signal transduction histidine kinase
MTMKWRAPWRGAESGRTLAPVLAPAVAESLARAQRVPEGAQCFQDVADAVTEPVWVVRPDGKLLYGNDRWYSLTRIAEGEDFPGRFVNLIHPEDRPGWTEAWQRGVRSRSAYEVERRVRFAPHQHFVRQLERAQPVWSADGEVVEWVLVATMRDDYPQLLDQMRRSLLRKDEALVAVAHEMRSPLAPIASAVRLLENRGNDPVFVADVQAMLGRQVAQLIRLVDDLLDLGRLEHQHLGVRKVRLDLRRVLAAALETTQPTITAAGHRLKTAVSPEAAIVDGDAGRLTQVLVNLLNNAAKFTGRGGRIWLSLERVQPGYVVRVRDSGIGIAPEMLPRIFDAYVQAAHDTPGLGGGLGLGLALARELAQLHGGRLTAHSAGIGKGSEFVLQLPAASRASERAGESA